MKTNPRIKYVKWMQRLLLGDIKNNELINYLFEKDFYAVIPEDNNRYADGLSVRYRFCYETGVDYEYFKDLMQEKPCSILEMIMGVVFHYVEKTLTLDDFEDQTKRCFREIIYSLGIPQAVVHGTHLKKQDLDEKFDKFLERRYHSNGKGSLFLLKSPPEDMRYVEIWWQMIYYINEWG